mmetsp:Transcript_110232/g.154670  ORF Transcript_110232/g.154670 Transcript_110232/m.154670 type:complete len:554 (+) Transcript_110232:60-1721(+)
MPIWKHKRDPEEEAQVYFSAVDGLKKLYNGKIKPVEKLYNFGGSTSHSRELTDAEFDARPQIMLLGQYSVGKSTFIRYLIEGDYPGSHIGPEPTTDRFIAVMHGLQERRTPGNAVAVSGDKPFKGLAQFGTAFLNKFECSQCPSPILQNLTFIDTPGVLSGDKQRIGRSYDFVRVMEWFAEKSDLILLLFDAHKLDISDEFKSTITALRDHDEKIRVVLNKADSVDTQSLMRVYGAMMWSLGKVVGTPEVKRVYISSFWEKPFANAANADLFEAEREDLFKELRSLPRYSSIRKINDLVKRARHVKVHALLIGYLKSQMPSYMGKASAQKKLMDTMPDVFRKVQKEYGLPFGDFPDLKKFKAKIADDDFSKYPKLDLKMIEDMDAVLSKDVPGLMAQFPSEREDEYRSLAKAPQDAEVHMPDGGGEAPPPRASAPPGSSGNPFAGSGGQSASSDWAITPAQQSKYTNIFKTCNPVNGLVSGEAAKSVLEKSRLPYDVLGKIWNMADVDEDGYLDCDEFCVAMHLCHEVMEGNPLGDKLDPRLVPLSKRGLGGE